MTPQPAALGVSGGASRLAESCRRCAYLTGAASYQEQRHVSCRSVPLAAGQLLLWGFAPWQTNGRTLTGEVNPTDCGTDAPCRPHVSWIRPWMVDIQVGEGR